MPGNLCVHPPKRARKCEPGAYGGRSLVWLWNSSPTMAIHHLPRKLGICHSRAKSSLGPRVLAPGQVACAETGPLEEAMVRLLRLVSPARVTTDLESSHKPASRP